MTTKRYRLTESAVPFVSEAMFRFRVAFTRRYRQASGSPGTMICGERSCPVLALREGGVVSTANDTTQAVLDGMFPPQNTIRNGKRHPRGKLWIDVTDSTGPEDVDLDIDQAINDYLATRQ